MNDHFWLYDSCHEATYTDANTNINNSSRIIMTEEDHHHHMVHHHNAEEYHYHRGDYRPPQTRESVLGNISNEAVDKVCLFDV